MANPRGEISITDLRALIKELRKINPTYVNQFYNDAKEIAKPVQDKIIQGIPSTAPVKGMRPRSAENGRLAWGIGRRAKSTQVRANRTVKRGSSFAKGRTNQYSIAYVAVRSPGTSLADMAGKSDNFTNKKPISRRYKINLFGRGTVIERDHKINKQGIFLIQKLNETGQASRFVWPSALKALPDAAKKVDRLLTRTNDVINANLRRTSGR